jgi:hypothetical protein
MGQGCCRKTSQKALKLASISFFEWNTECFSSASFLLKTGQPSRPPVFFYLFLSVVISKQRKLIKTSNLIINPVTADRLLTKMDFCDILLGLRNSQVANVFAEKVI